MRKVFDMDRHEPNLTEAELGGVGSRTLVMAADDDSITLEHTLSINRGIERSELAVVTGTSHFLQEKPDVCNTLVVDFLTKQPVPTVAPIRRAALTT